MKQEDFDQQLLKAAENGNLGGIEKAIKNKANVNIKDGNGSTALHLAVRSNYLDIIQLLISYEADVNGRDNEGNTPLYDAV